MEGTVEFFGSFFSSPNLIGIGLAIVFGALWLLAYWPPLFKEYWLWAVLAMSAFLTLIAISFVQIPLQNLVAERLIDWLGVDVYLNWLLLTGIPLALLSGVVQEGAKLVPITAYWWANGRNISPKMGLALGAAAGAGFGIFEAQWVHNTILNAGWNWDMVSMGGVTALAGFWERFFSIGLHMGASALAGYGLAKGKGWQFYLVALLIHALANYTVFFVQKGMLTVLQVEILLAGLVILLSYATLWLRWRKNNAVIEEVIQE